jgi:hypothetical protein
MKIGLSALRLLHTHRHTNEHRNFNKHSGGWQMYLKKDKKCSKEEDKELLQSQIMENIITLQTAFKQLYLHTHI